MKLRLISEGEDEFGNYEIDPETLENLPPFLHDETFDRGLYEEWVRQQFDAAAKRGYQLIEGLFDSNSDNVYKIVALCKDPENWEPYRAPRGLADCDAFALFWWFDEELTGMNMDGNMIYTEPDPDDYDDRLGYDDESQVPTTGEYAGLEDIDEFGGQEVNTPTYELVEDIGELIGMVDDDLDAFIERLYDVMQMIEVGVYPDRWDGAFKVY
jgi:hypothetical protein